MARMRRKGDLPTKVCETCGRPFAWRKKWADVWDEVRYCSDGCRRHKGKPPSQAPAEAQPSPGRRNSH